MKIGIVGLWHLGFVYGACLAQLGHEVIACDTDVEIIRRAQKLEFPVEEYGLTELIRENVANRSLTFSDSLASLDGCEVVWVTHDVPIDSVDQADLAELDEIFIALNHQLLMDQIVIVSSQVPVGYCRRKLVESVSSGRRLLIGYSPENLRLGQSLHAFTSQKSWAIGTSETRVAEAFRAIFEGSQVDITECAIETAEMIKHGLNAFLAVSVTFGNELGRVCREVGADGNTVARFLKKDGRVGKNAYIVPGGPISGGTLLRDVKYLSGVSAARRLELPIIESIWSSNQSHQRLMILSIIGACTPTSEPIVVIGLSYKEGSSSTRQSFALQLAAELIDRGIELVLFDPLVDNAPLGHSNLGVSHSISNALGRGGNVILMSPPPDATIFMNEIGQKPRVIVDLCEYPELERVFLPGLKVVSLNDLQ